MTRKNSSGTPKPPVRDNAVVPYLTARDRLLAARPAKDADLPAYLCEVGAYVIDRWLAEERDRPEGAPLDEQATDPRWNECSERAFRDIRAKARAQFSEQMDRKRAAAFVKLWSAKLDPISGVLKASGWAFMEAFRGFVGSVGILLFGLIFLWTSPMVVKAFRATIDDIAPADTRPDSEQKAAAGGTDSAAPAPKPVMSPSPHPRPRVTSDPSGRAKAESSQSGAPKVIPGVAPTISTAPAGSGQGELPPATVKAELP